MVIIIIGDKIFHRIVGEQRLHLTIKLGRQGFVRGEDQGRSLDLADDMRGGERLARSGDAKQHLVALAILDSLDKFLDGGWLVTSGREFGLQVEIGGCARTRDNHLANG